MTKNESSELVELLRELEETLVRLKTMKNPERRAARVSKLSLIGKRHTPDHA